MKYFAGIDIRSLGIFRIVIGIFTIYNIIFYRLSYVDMFYQKDGLVSESLKKEFFGNLFSLLTIIDNKAWVIFLMLLTLLLAILFTIGWKTKYITPLLFILFSNLVSANPFVIHAVEFLLEVALFWSIFLPVNAAFSIGNQGVETNKLELKSLAVFAFVLQLFIIYFTSFITKTGELWTSGLTVLALTDDRMHGILLSNYLADFPGICKVMSYGTLVIEGIIPILMLSFWKKKEMRLLTSILLLVLHYGLALTLNVGPFYIMGTAFAILLLPDIFWNRFFPNSIKHVNLSNIPPVDKPKFVQWTQKLILIVLIVFISQSCLNKWQKNSYLSNTINAIPVLNTFSSWKIPRVGTFFGILEQPWLFFAPSIYKEMGTFMIAGRTDSNKFINLQTNEEISTVNDPVNGDKYFTPKHKNCFKHSEFVFAFYARRFLLNSDKEAFNKWLKVIIDKWRKKHPKERLLEAKFFYLTNSTSLVNDELKRSQTIYELANKVY